MIKDKKRQKDTVYKHKGGRSIFIKILVAFIFLSTVPVIFSSFLTISTFQEVIESHITPISGDLILGSDREITQDLYLTEQNVRVQLILLIFLTITLTLFVSILITRSLTNPVKTLVQGTKAIAAGHLNFRLNIKSPSEMAELAHAFNQMTGNLQVSQGNLEIERDKTKSIINYLTDGLIVVDKHMNLSLVNPRAEEMLGLKEKDILGEKIKEEYLNSKHFFYRNLAQVVFAKGDKVAKGAPDNLPQSYEITLEQPKELVLEVTITPLYDVKEKVFGSMSILHDITREKEVDRMKTEFVSIAAHQLRTPLSAVKWSLRMLLDGDVGKLSKEQGEFLVKGYQSNERMITLINDLLNVARIEEGRFLHDLTFQSLEEIIEKVLAGSDTLIKKKKLKLVFIKPKSSLPKIKVDGEKISLVVQNLLDNAIRFNKEGGRVTVTIKYDKMNIEVMVEDTGIGIPSSQQDRIFTKFFRSDIAVKSETEGTGLGLFISKNIVEAHGGKIWFESKENKGTTFWFTLPIKQ